MSAISRGQPKLNISTRAAKLNIRQRRPRLKIKHRRAQMQVRKRAPEFKINRSVVNVKKNIAPAVKISPRFLRAPIIGASKYMDDFADESGLNSSGIKFTQEESLAGNPLEYMTIDEMNDPVQVEKINLEWDQGDIDINWTDDIMEIEWDIDTSPDIYVEPYDIQIYVQENTPRNVKAKAAYIQTGRKLDKKI